MSNNNNSLNPFNTNSNKTNLIPISNPQNSNLGFSSTNTPNLFGSKPFGSGSITNSYPFSSNTNPQQSSNKDDNKDYEANKPNPFANANAKPNNLFNSNIGNAFQNISNQGALGNSFLPPQNNNSLLQNKDNNQGAFGKQISFSSGTEGQANNLFGNLQNNVSGNLFGNANNTTNNITNNVNNQNKRDLKDSAQIQNNLVDTKNSLNNSSGQVKDNKNEANNTSIEQNLNVNKKILGANNNDNKINMFSNPENKIGSNNSFLQPKPTNKESDKGQNSSFPSVDKKIQNPENNLKTSKLTEKSNENNINNSNLASFNNDPPKNESNKLNKDSKSLLNNTGIKKPSEQIKESRTIEDFKIDKLMSLSIDDLINKWKLELDNQVEKFEKAADSIKNFELNFQSQYDKVGHLSELINKITENGENTLNELSNISKEEDYIIDQLDCMERNLDKFFDVVSKNSNLNEKSFLIDDKIYSSALELDSNIKDVQKEIDMIQNNFNVQSENHAKKVENLKNIHLKNSEDSFDEKDISEILNSYFDSLRALQLMMHSVESKVQDISFDLNENNKKI